MREHSGTQLANIRCGLKGVVCLQEKDGGTAGKKFVVLLICIKTVFAGNVGNRMLSGYCFSVSFQRNLLDFSKKYFTKVRSKKLLSFNIIFFYSFVVFEKNISKQKGSL